MCRYICTARERIHDMVSYMCSNGSQTPLSPCLLTARPLASTTSQSLNDLHRWCHLFLRASIAQRDAPKCASFLYRSISLPLVDLQMRKYCFAHERGWCLKGRKGFSGRLQAAHACRCRSCHLISRRIDLFGTRVADAGEVYAPWRHPRTPYTEEPQVTLACT